MTVCTAAYPGRAERCGELHAARNHPAPWLTLGWVLVVFACWLCTAPAQAQSGRRVALLIGNAAYTGGMPALSYPLQDVSVLEQSLKRLNFEVQVVRNADQRAMGRAIRDFGNRAREAQVALVYYSGHGMQARDENYLIPVGATIQTEGDLDIDAVPLRTLMRQIEDARPRTAVVVLDACRDNPVAARTKSGTKGLSRVQNPPNNTLVVFAALPGTTATDNGVFAKELASRIVEPNVGIRTVFDKVGQAVRQATNQRQAIQRDDQLNEDVVLLGSVAALIGQRQPIGVAQADPEEEAWAEVKDSQNVAALEVVLQQFPSGRYATRIRARLAALKATAPAQVAAAPRLDSAIAAATMRPLSVFKDCPDCPEMVVIPAGSFTMGSTEFDSEKPPHGVSIQSFAIGRTEVTQRLWQAVMGNNPSSFNNCGNDCPVEQVRWNDIQQFIQRLNARTGKTYRLPSEAEWEYAANAGSTGRWSFGDNEGQVGEHAWFVANSGRSTQRVAQKQPNAFGLYDMHGNVWEWVEDCWHVNYNGAPTDGSAWTTACSVDYRVLRGGSWDNSSANIRSANRIGGAPDYRLSSFIGFRLARTLVNP
jgi:formylglycine-generating enzyme required for sulfatase activity